VAEVERVLVDGRRDDTAVAVLDPGLLDLDVADDDPRGVLDADDPVHRDPLVVVLRPRGAFNLHLVLVDGDGPVLAVTADEGFVGVLPVVGGLPVLVPVLFLPRKPYHTRRRGSAAKKPPPQRLFFAARKPVV
jgi:hypothetical protein